ncbi:hypothetical protein H8N03_21920 [Ramlibacter sp. USB13]|uniref:Alpha/beta hydrolase n=1 Tax=Ramlibacter cellulosilyticus TaxID=2764187 RepID=A0A923MWV2_9BURK|nr:hypothetical protein [Ramlibacter cellulosilyticus]MBC5785614.1 hypothetical protein [Ramlibacter cellulosilyticus]
MNARVQRRHVFFVSGFDPKGAGWYHALYARNAAAQAGITGCRYEVGPRRRGDDGNATWTIRQTGADGTADTTYEYVRWDDLVRAHWPRRALDVALAALATYWAMLRSGRLAQVHGAAPRTLVPLAFPALFWLSILLLAVVAGAAVVAWLPAGLLPRVLAALALSAVLVAAALAWERSLHTSWLLRIYRFAHLHAMGEVQGLDERLDRLARRIDEKVRDQAIDEVLVVGFSVGSILAVSAAARAAERGAPLSGRLSLLTLGHCIPLLGLMPAATRFRAELARLAREEGVSWIDFSSPTDWGSFALVDPVPLCLGAAAPPPGDRRFVSPRFHALFAPATYHALRRDKRRMHLQYLMAGERDGGYDYFALTAGPLPLRAHGGTGVPA